MPNTHTSEAIATVAGAAASIIMVFITFAACSAADESATAALDANSVAASANALASEANDIAQDARAEADAANSIAQQALDLQKGASDAQQAADSLEVSLHFQQWGTSEKFQNRSDPVIARIVNNSRRPIANISVIFTPCIPSQSALAADNVGCTVTASYTGMRFDVALGLPACSIQSYEILGTDTALDWSQRPGGTSQMLSNLWELRGTMTWSDESAVYWERQGGVKRAQTGESGQGVLVRTGANPDRTPEGVLVPYELVADSAISNTSESRYPKVEGSSVSTSPDCASE